MSSICHNSNSANLFLYLIIRVEEVLFARNDSENTIIITWNTAEIYQNDDLGLLRDSSFQCFIIHLQRILLAVHQNELCTHMTNNRCRCCVCIGRNNNFVPLIYPKNTKSCLSTCRLRVQANSLRYANPLCYFFLKQLCLRTCGNSAGTERIAYFIDFRFRNVRRRKRDIHFIFFISCIAHTLIFPSYILRASIRMPLCF